ncbi:MAG: L-lactate permease [Paracoccaceae bacterium]
MGALVAALPLGVILALMLGLGRSALVAGAAGLAVAVVAALAVFDPGGPLPTTTAFAGIGAEALHATGVILWIVLPALALYEFQTAAGSVGRIRAALAALTAERRLQAVLIAWFFGLFMEGAAGFGVPVALAAPLLAGLGIAPVRAVVLALLGHAAGVSFGAVGTPTLAQAATTGVAAGEIAVAVASLHAVFATVLLGFVVVLAEDGWPDRRTLVLGLLAAPCFLLPFLAVAVFTGPELPSLLGALVGIVVYAAILRRAGGGGTDLRALLPDLVPYLCIVVAVLATRLAPPVREALSGLAIGWDYAGAFEGSFAPLYHPGTLLFAGLAVGALATGRGALLVPSLAAAVRRLVPVALTLAVMLTLSRLMVHAGMIDALAEAAARTGPVWPLIAPWIGVLGTFVTGSATASNILFSAFQVSTADALSLSPVAMLAAQGLGSAIGNVVAPHNIIAGSATVGLTAREGAVLARTVPACLVYALAGGASLLVWGAL